MPRSYDSSKEDAQNPWPDYEESPPGKKESPPGKKESSAGKKESPAGKKESPEGKKESRKRESAAAAEETSPTGKRAFQSGKAGKQPLRTDSMQTEVQTPPPKLKRANTSELTGSFDDVEDTQQVDDPKEPASDPAPKPASPRAKSAAKAKPKAAAAATKSAAKNKAAPKTKSKGKHGPPRARAMMSQTTAARPGRAPTPRFSPSQPSPRRSRPSHSPLQSPSPASQTATTRKTRIPATGKKESPQAVHEILQKHSQPWSQVLFSSFLYLSLSLSLLSGLETLLQSEDLKKPRSLHAKGNQECFRAVEVLQPICNHQQVCRHLQLSLLVCDDSEASTKCPLFTRTFCPLTGIGEIAWCTRRSKASIALDAGASGDGSPDLSWKITSRIRPLWMPLLSASSQTST